MDILKPARTNLTIDFAHQYCCKSKEETRLRPTICSICIPHLPPTIIMKIDLYNMSESASFSFLF